MIGSTLVRPTGIDTENLVPLFYGQTVRLLSVNSRRHKCAIRIVLNGPEYLREVGRGEIYPVVTGDTGGTTLRYGHGLVVRNPSGVVQ